MMNQRQQPHGFGTDGSDWLAGLIHSFEETERRGDLACDSQTVCAAKLRLLRPAAPGRALGRPVATALEVRHSDLFAGHL
jgi:hypothetical protein